ncbi:MAG TPA: beta-propeller fold lactonase family protein [Bryobacteraceae bacterium]|nr:beta-propeller fold lactonase family protein [Bryobacteraceae bacterium]
MSAATLITSAAEPQQSEHGKRLMLVVSKGLPGITVYDADSQKPLCNATMGVSPHEAAFSADGHYAYVPVYGNSGVGKPGTDEHIIHFVRTSDCQEVGSLDTGEYKRPHCVLVGKSGRLYVTAEIAASVIVIDPNTRKIIATIPTGSHTTHMIALTRDEKTIYSSNVQSKTISVLDVAKCKLVQTIPTEGENQRMTLSPDGRWFVTSLGPAKKVAFYRTSDNQLDFTVPVDGTPFVAKFSADGKYLYDAGHVEKRVVAWKIDVAQRKVVATSSDDLGRDTGALEVNPFTGGVYVSDQPTNKISELDPSTWKVVKTLDTEKTPDCMQFVTVR